MELSCREIKKRKKGGRRVKREIENEKKEDGRAEIIKVWDRYASFRDCTNGKRSRSGNEDPVISSGKHSITGKKIAALWWPQEAGP